MKSIASLIQPVLELHNSIQKTVVGACEQAAVSDMSAIDHDTEGDTIYAVDRISEDLLVDFVNREIAQKVPVVLIAEGLRNGGKIVLPEGTKEAQAEWRIIVDPIDGTRGLMYQKRSAWILTGIAPNKGDMTTLADISLAVQTEIPLVKQHLADQLWVVRGGVVHAERWNRITGERTPMVLHPSGERTIAHGFVSFARFFPGMRVPLSEIDEAVTNSILGPVRHGKALCFEDQYICTGGQLYELMMGHDRFVADLRPVVEPLLRDQGLTLGLCCHPYDLCTELIARELGVVITDASGNQMSVPLNVEADVAWIGYANVAIQAEVEPVLQAELRKRGLIR